MELRDYLRGLRRHWVAIILMTMLGASIGYAWTLIQTPVYEATASGFVAARQTADVGFSTVGDSLARSKVNSYIDIAGWRVVAEGAIEQLGIDATPESVAGRVTVTNPPDTVILKIAARGASAEEARALAEAWIRALGAQIDVMEGTGEPNTSPVTIVPGDSASLPSSPLFPDVQTAVIVGALVGLGFGIAFALIRTVSDRRVRSSDDLEGRTGVAVVGSIPVTSGLDDEHRLITDRGAKGKGSSFAVTEAMRSLRTNLQFMDVDNPPRTIVVTSPLPGDGKSTVACNLALTLAASGSPVVLVDGDLRRSTVAHTMGLPGGAGLTDVLSGRAELSDVLQRTERSANLYVLTAGSVPPNPSEVLGSGRMRSLLSELAAHATVIVDAPPLLPVTDGAVLTHQADGALLVISLGKTTYDLVEKSLDTLNKANGRALGIVVNRVPMKGMDASPYSYEYRREYGAHGEAQGSVPSESSTTPFDLDGVFAVSGSDDDASADAGRARARRV